MKTGLIHIYFGDGKGKTTASIGIAVRAAGKNLKVLFAQFLKGKNSGERNILANLQNVSLSEVPSEINFCINMSDEEKNSAKIFYKNLFKEIVKNCLKYDLIILDEILGTIECGFIKENEVLNFLKTKPENLEVVLTGRCASKRLLSLANYASEIKKIKHPFDSSIPAREGIEF